MEEIANHERTPVSAIIITAIIMSSWAFYIIIHAYISAKMYEASSLLDFLLMIADYNSMMGLYPVFFLVGTYSVSALGKSKTEALTFGMMCVFLSIILVTIISTITVAIVLNMVSVEYDGGSGINFGFITKSIFAGLLGSSIRISTTDYNHKMATTEYNHNSLKSFEQEQALTDIGSISSQIPILQASLISQQQRLEAIESKVNSERFTTILYGRN